MMAGKWPSQARQWPTVGPSGLSNEVVSHAGVVVDCLPVVQAHLASKHATGIP